MLSSTPIIEHSVRYINNPNNSSLLYLTYNTVKTKSVKTMCLINVKILSVTSGWAPQLNRATKHMPLSAASVGACEKVVIMKKKEKDVEEGCVAHKTGSDICT